MSNELYSVILWSWLLLAVPVYVLLQFVTAPFGRHTRKGWGPILPNRIAWIMMESVSLITFLYCYITGPAEKTWVTWTFAALWSIHYINRSFIFPFRMRSGDKKKMPVAIFTMAVFFNLINGFLNGYYLGNFTEQYSPDWFHTPFFIFGFILFFTGMYINNRADHILINLRKPGETDYKIPYGFLFKYISCPNHFGEIVEWTGFAIMTWNPAGISFALWTFANLAPRAKAHHQWYKENFPDYPESRKAVIPGLL